MATLAFIVADGVIYASWLFIVAVGMTLVYGVMRILNVAHGSLYALGAYTAATMVGAWFQRGYAPLGAFAVLLAAALIVGLVMGLILELGLLRFLYGRDEVVVFLVPFLIGSVLGALGGAYTAPMISVSRGLGVDVIVLAFAVVVVGGMGSIPGAFLGAIVIGLSRAAAVHLLPQAEVFAIYLIMTLVLIVRPHGLLGREQLRKV